MSLGAAPGPWALSSTSPPQGPPGPVWSGTTPSLTRRGLLSLLGRVPNSEPPGSPLLSGASSGPAQLST